MMSEVMGEVMVVEVEEGRHCCQALVVWQAQRSFVHFR
jgi:hypothetical protein